MRKIRLIYIIFCDLIQMKSVLLKFVLLINYFFQRFRLFIENITSLKTFNTKITINYYYL